MACLSAPAQPPFAASAPSPSRCCSTLLSWAASPPYHPHGVVHVRWERPAPGWLKLNFDGSYYYDGSNRASIGGAIRDCNGRVLLAFAEPTEHSSVGVVEAQALIRGLRLALSRFRGRLVVEGDDLMLVQLLREEYTERRIPPAMQEEIIQLLGCFSAYKVQHIYREGNQVADLLCKEAYQRPGLWWGGLVPRAILEKVQDDAHGVSHVRLCKTKIKR